MKQPKSDDIVGLYPPKIGISPLSNKYDLILTVTWGNYEQEFTISKETHGVWDNAIAGINKALLEGSETNPYILK